jgi:hypothetical protein
LFARSGEQQVYFKLSALAVLLGLATGAQAEKPRFGDTLSFSLGGMSHRGEATISSTRDGDPTDKLDFEDLGLDSETEVVWADFTWQFAERWQTSLSYSSFDSDGGRSASEEGSIGNIDWAVGAQLTTEFDLNLYIADVTWDFVKTDKAHIGVGVGLHAADLDMDVTVEVGAEIGGVGGVVEVKRESTSVLAPLPNVSLVGGWMITEKLYLGGHLGYLSLTYDKYDGELFSARGALEWRPWRNFGLGAAYQYVDIDLTVDNSSTTDEWDLKFYGPILFLSVGF